jgi:hypothetical protein
VAFRPGGSENMVASGSDDETIRIWGFKERKVCDSDSENEEEDEGDKAEVCAGVFVLMCLCTRMYVLYPCMYVCICLHVQ